VCDYACYESVRKGPAPQHPLGNVPAGRVEENARVWFLNAFENCSERLARHVCRGGSNRTHRRTRGTPPHSDGRHGKRSQTRRERGRGERDKERRSVVSLQRQFRSQARN